MARFELTPSDHESLGVCHWRVQKRGAQGLKPYAHVIHRLRLFFFRFRMA